MSYWASKRVLVTGGTGFLGRAVIGAIPSVAQVIAHGSLSCDLRSLSCAREYVADVNPDIIIHLAGLVGGIGANRAKPYDFFLDNMRMGTSILDACRVNEIPTLVMIGTTCSYPKFTPTPFREADLWNGFPEETNAPYGLAKRMLIAAAQTLEKQHGVRVVNIIPTNLYGPGDKDDPNTSHVIPALMRKLDAWTPRGPDVMIWGTGKATRDFLYVDDGARGIVHLTEHAKNSEPINVGSGTEVSIEDLLDAMIAAGDLPRPQVSFDTSKPDGQPRRRLCIERAKSLGWSPSVSLEVGLRLTWEDFRRRVR